MSDYYHHFLSSMSGIGANPTTSPQDAHPPQIPGSHMPLNSGTVPNPYQNLGYFTGFPDPILFNAPKTQKNRRKSASGLDHVKHRRTRSGCYMCRSRRVKCDESRPICDRCKKGNRECVYPEPPGPKGSAGQSATAKESAGLSQQTSPNSSNEEEDEEVDRDVKLDPIPDEDEELDDAYPVLTKPSSSPRRASTASSVNLQRMGTRNSSETPSQDGNKSSSPSASTGTNSSQATTTYLGSEYAMQSLSRSADWSHLPPDFQHYLNYFCENVTHYHYCLLNDADDFFRTILPNIAVRNEALLYAVVGFAAYHSTLQNPNGRIQEFLRYYNKSVTLLLVFLKRKEKHTIATLLTILQLATIEEYLGDWVNLMGHQKAALEVLTKLFTPQSVMQSALGRMVLAWYARFDVFVALMGGFPTALGREWFVSCVDYCHSQVLNTQDQHRWSMDEESGRLRLISMEMSMLYSRRSRGGVSPSDFAHEHEQLTERLQQWKAGWDQTITDPSSLVTDFSWGRPLEEGDIVNPYMPGVLYDFPNFATTMMTSEWHSIVIMHLCQSTTIPRDQLFAQLGQHAYAICQIFEAVERWPHSPKGSLVLIQACIAIGALFLPQDARHHMWTRKKFALLETMGYMHPITLRSKMSELFQEPSCVRWWLPNDEGFTSVLQSVRTFADERNAVAVSAQAENLREVRHIFANLELGDDDMGLDMKGKGKDSST